VRRDHARDVEAVAGRTPVIASVRPRRAIAAISRGRAEEAGADGS
jgi:hypothetical protein